MLAEGGAGLTLVFADGFVVVGAGAELGGFGFDEFFLQLKDDEGGAGAGFEPLLAGVEAFLGEPAGLGGGDDALAGGDDLTAGVVRIDDDFLLQLLEGDEGFGDFEPGGVGGTAGVAVRDGDADDGADGPGGLVAGADVVEAGAEVVFKAEEGEAAGEVEAGEDGVFCEGEGNVAALEIEDGLAVVGPEGEGLADAGGHVGAEGGRRRCGNLDAHVEEALDVVGDELLQKVFVIEHGALGEDDALLAGGDFGARLGDIERGHDADFHARFVVAKKLAREFAGTLGDAEVFLREVEFVVHECRGGDDVDDAAFQGPLGDEDVVPGDADLGEVRGGAGPAEEGLAEGETGGGGDVVGELIEDAEAVARADAEIVGQADGGRAGEAGAEVVEAVDAADGEPHAGVESGALRVFLALRGEVEDGVEMAERAGDLRAGDARLKALDFDGKVFGKRGLNGAFGGEPEQRRAGDFRVFTGKNGERQRGEEREGEERAGVQGDGARVCLIISRGGGILIANARAEADVAAAFDTAFRQTYSGALRRPNMPAASPITRQTVGQTFTVALSVLGAGVVLQLGAVGWAFIARNHAQPETGELPTMARLTSPVGMRPDFTSNPFDETPEPPPAQLTTDPNAPELPRKPVPVPVGSQRTAEAVPQTRFDELIQQGKQLRERGDTGNALTRFREAGAMDPRNPIAIAELASTYEKMRMLDRSSEQWKRIYEMGDAAGIYFSLAESKLKETQARAILEAMPQTGATGAPGPDTSVLIEGIAPGALIGLGKIRTEEQADANAQKKFTLHIPVRARPRAKVEVHDLVIHVMFYDKVDGKNVVPTSADVGSKWVTSPVDWADSDTEELAVEYQLPRPEKVKRETREFFGYLVRIYYKQQLQAAVAEPERLGQQYPAPPTLPQNNEP